MAAGTPFTGLMPMMEVPVNTSLGFQTLLMGVFCVSVNFICTTGKYRGFSKANITHMSNEEGGRAWYLHGPSGSDLKLAGLLDVMQNEVWVEHPLQHANVEHVPCPKHCLLRPPAAGGSLRKRTAITVRAAPFASL